MISRQSWFVRNIATTTAESTTPKIDMREAAGGTIFIVGAPVSFTFYGATDKDATFYQLHDSSNNAVSRTVTQGKAYALPDECFGCRYIKLVANTAGVVDIALKG